MAQWARENVPELIRLGRGKRETDKFVNFWRAKSGKDATKHNWPATWRNWMLSAEERLPSSTSQPNGNPRQQATNELFDQAMQRAQAREAAM